MTSSVSSASVWPGTLTNILEMIPTSVAKYSVMAASLNIRGAVVLVQTVGKASLTSKMQRVRAKNRAMYIYFNRCQAN